MDENRKWPYGIGLGTAERDKEQPEKMAELLEQAVLSGYRFLDTAYGPELPIMLDSTLPRQ